MEHQLTSVMVSLKDRPDELSTASAIGDSIVELDVTLPLSEDVALVFGVEFFAK